MREMFATEDLKTTRDEATSYNERQPLDIGQKLIQNFDSQFVLRKCKIIHLVESFTLIDLVIIHARLNRFLKEYQKMISE